MVSSALEWTVPGLLFLCAVTLLVVVKSNTTSVNWGTGWLVIAVAYTLIMVQLSKYAPVKQLLEDAFVLVGVCTCCRAYLTQSGLQRSTLFDWSVGILSLLVALSMISFFNNLRLESMSIIFGSSTYLAACLWRTRKVQKTLASWMLKTTFVFVFTALVAQAVAYAFIPDSAGAGALWADTLWGKLIQYTAIFGGIVVTLGVLVFSNIGAVIGRNHSNSNLRATGGGDPVPQRRKALLSYLRPKILSNKNAPNLDIAASTAKKEAFRLPRNLENLEPKEVVLIREALSNILASHTFASSPRLKYFISYIVEESLANRADQIKEFSIAVDVFGRKFSQDLTGDSVVRTAANRLRQKLAKFYSEEGSMEKIVIFMPVGGYIPFFLFSELYIDAQNEERE